MIDLNGIVFYLFSLLFIQYDVLELYNFILNKSKFINFKNIAIGIIKTKNKIIDNPHISKYFILLIIVYSTLYQKNYLI